MAQADMRADQTAMDRTGSPQDQYGTYDYADEANITRVNELLGENIQGPDG